jgi:hypothetical protein
MDDDIAVTLSGAQATHISKITASDEPGYAETVDIDLITERFVEEGRHSS